MQLPSKSWGKLLFSASIDLEGKEERLCQDNFWLLKEHRAYTNLVKVNYSISMKTFQNFTIKKQLPRFHRECEKLYMPQTTKMF